MTSNSDSSQNPALIGAAENDVREAAEGARTSLDKRTQLVKPSRRPIQDSGWKFTFWPSCGEASLVIVTSGSSRARGTERDCEKSPSEVSEARLISAATLHWRLMGGSSKLKREYSFPSRSTDPILWNPSRECNSIVARLSGSAR